ncbi:class I SAM-dependent methyltransferase [Billgrantia desiderata]|uniref:class I SAM-dependent methyltransferase n=1 Tax=Billgrantia desiderata TaxID=52021 RepID=UPI00089EF766|nr:class I SAM-dependent methyltransferase [Halomonas desiderata]SEG45265.1 hypothetical protein SAMN04487953_13425 [Halomonas desiderata]
MSEDKSICVTNNECYKRAIYFWQQGDWDRLIELSSSVSGCKNHPLLAVLISAAHAQKGEKEQAIAVCKNIDFGKVYLGNKSFIISLLLSGVHSNVSEAFMLVGDKYRAAKHGELSLEVLNAHRDELKVAPVLFKDGLYKAMHEEIYLGGWPSLESLYLHKKEGKISDKWRSYLKIYNKLLSSYRKSNITLFEIGIQNGGSLEIWQDYFPNAKKIVGCDINEKCSELVYKGENIEVVTGDAKNANTYDKIVSISNSFDIVFDDGSHDSVDCIKNFVKYFPHVKREGVFIVEDVHCSYWKEFSGGLYHPFSTMSFFKDLLDVLNFEHWGVELDIKEYLEKYNDAIEDENFYQSLFDIQSIEFFNSVIAIKKRMTGSVGLGNRVIVGQKGLITGDDYVKNNGATIRHRDQSDNVYSRR